MYKKLLQILKFISQLSERTENGWIGWKSLKILVCVSHFSLSNTSQIIIVRLCLNQFLLCRWKSFNGTSSKYRQRSGKSSQKFYAFESENCESLRFHHLTFHQVLTTGFNISLNALFWHVFFPQCHFQAINKAAHNDHDKNFQDHLIPNFFFFISTLHLSSI